MNEWGFRPPLYTYRLNWARRTSWGWWEEWDDTALQTQDSKFEPWRSEVEHVTEAPHNIESPEWAEKKHLFETWRPGCGSNPRSPSYQAGSFNHCTRTPASKNFMDDIETGDVWLFTITMWLIAIITTWCRIIIVYAIHAGQSNPIQTLRIQCIRKIETTGRKIQADTI